MNNLFKSKIQKLLMINLAKKKWKSWRALKMTEPSIQINKYIYAYIEITEIRYRAAKQYFLLLLNCREFFVK